MAGALMVLFVRNCLSMRGIGIDMSYTHTHTHTHTHTQRVAQKNHKDCTSVVCCTCVWATVTGILNISNVKRHDISLPPLLLGAVICTNTHTHTHTQALLQKCTDHLDIKILHISMQLTQYFLPDVYEVLLHNSEHSSFPLRYYH